MRHIGRVLSDRPQGDDFLDSAIARLRWAILATALLITLAWPIAGRTGHPLWIFILLFAGYNLLVELLRKSRHWPRARTWLPALDLVVAAALYYFDAEPTGPLFVIFFLVVASAAVRLTLGAALLYTAVVIVVASLIAPTLPLWTSSGVYLRQFASRLVVLALVGAGTAFLTRRLARDEEGLRGSEAKLRLITGQMPAHLWMTDTALRVTSTLGTGLAPLGIDSRVYVGKALDELSDPAEEPLAAHRRALAGEPAGYTIGIRGRDFEARVEPLRDARGRIVGCLGLALDITERQQAEVALAARARQQAAVADLGRRALATPDLGRVMDEAVALVARTLDVEYCKVLELLPDGGALRLCAGVGWRDGLVGGATVGAGVDSQAGYTLLADGPVIVEDLRRETRFSGPPLLHEHGVISGMSVVIPGEGRPFGVLGAHTTRRRRFTPDDSHFLRAVANVIATAIARQDFERRLAREEAAAQAERDRAARLAELDRLRREFVASVSHDLRTPLTSIRAGVGLLATRALDRLDPDERDMLAVVRRNIERLANQVDYLLTANQLEAGALRLTPEPLDLRAVATDAVAAVHPLYRGKGQALEVDLPEPLPVEGDARRLGQALVNLLDNAHYHTPSGTRIAVSGCADGAEVRLAVSDDGPGIPPGELERVFERFHRLSAAAGGSGLGLATAKALVELHGGRIWIESRPGEGATFHIALPRATDGG